MKTQQQIGPKPKSKYFGPDIKKQFKVLNTSKYREIKATLLDENRSLLSAIQGTEYKNFSEIKNTLIQKCKRKGIVKGNIIVVDLITKKIITRKVNFTKQFFPGKKIQNRKPKRKVPCKHNVKKSMQY